MVPVLPHNERDSVANDPQIKQLTQCAAVGCETFLSRRNPGDFLKQGLSLGNHFSPSVQSLAGRGRQQDKQLAGSPNCRRGHIGDTVNFQLVFFSVSRSIATTFPCALRLARVTAWAHTSIVIRDEP